MNLTQPNVSYILISSDNISDLVSVLYAKDFNVLPIKGFYEGIYEDSVLAFSDVDNDELRKDTIFLLEHFRQECAIIKYQNETGAKKIFRDGSEKPLGVVMYNTDSENKSYLYDGVSFSFIEQARYWKPTKKDDLKVGMLVEYLNNNKWYQKKIQDPEREWDDFWKLLIKYDKVRVCSN